MSAYLTTTYLLDPQSFFFLKTLSSISQFGNLTSSDTLNVKVSPNETSRDPPPPSPAPSGLALIFFAAYVNYRCFWVGTFPQNSKECPLKCKLYPWYRMKGPNILFISDPIMVMPNCCLLHSKPQTPLFSHDKGVTFHRSTFLKNKYASCIRGVDISRGPAIPKDNIYSALFYVRQSMRNLMQIKLYLNYIDNIIIDMRSRKVNLYSSKWP